MALNLFTFPRFVSLLIRLKLLNLTSSFAPLPGGLLDEQTDLLCRAQGLLGGDPTDQSTPAQARLGMRSSIKMLNSLGGLLEKVDSIRHLSIPAEQGHIPAMLYLPGEARDYPLCLYFHGGGFVIGDLFTTDSICRFLCRRAGCAVLSVDYRLAPEYPFPAAVEDCLAASQWAVAHATDLCADPTRVLVGGDSAGGTLAAVISQLSRQSGPRLLGQCLFYASTDSSSFDTPSFLEFGEQPLGLTRRDIVWFLNQYAPDPKDRLDPRVSPLLEKDLSGLPPALVVTAEYDVLRDEGEAYAKRLQEAGVPCTLMRCGGMIHGFLTMIGLLRRATLYFDQIATEIRHMIEEVPQREGEILKAH
jgi:acetyl esterase